jgi:uncharacterized membrane protein YphA (DoxX/SURF4 family)
MEPQTIEAAEAPRQQTARRVGMRFLFAYFLLFVLTGEEVREIPFLTPLFEKYTDLWHAVAVWVGRHLLDIRHEIVLDGGGSGDTTFRWILLLCYPVVAAAVAVVWSMFDRRRDERVDAWLRFLLRFTLATAMIVYGISKVIPNQMPAPRPTTLLQRLGELTPMRLLWTYMGASAPYQIFTGLAELLGGVLLLVPRTTLLGALVAFADMTMVLMLNLCYDVPVKINSLHYWIMALVLIAPDARRLLDALVLNRVVEPAAPAPLFARPRHERAAQILFLIFGLYLMGTSTVEGIERYRERNPLKPPFYGAWTVEEFAVDGKDVPPATDPQRWRWAVFQDPGRLTVKQMIGSFRQYPLAWDRDLKTMRLGKDRLAVAAPEPDVLVLDGALEGRSLRAKLRRMALRPSFHWLYDPEIE